MLPHGISSFLHGIGEYVMPIRTETAFKEKGVLSVEEFIAAGDQLVYKCPTWQWATGEEKEIRPYLPRDKQFLITRDGKGKN